MLPDRPSHPGEVSESSPQAQAHYLAMSVNRKYGLARKDELRTSSDTELGIFAPRVLWSAKQPKAKISPTSQILSKYRQWP